MVTTELVLIGGARIELRQEVWRGTDRLFTAVVTLVCLTDSGQPARVPADIRALLQPLRH